MRKLTLKAIYPALDNAPEEMKNRPLAGGQVSLYRPGSMLRVQAYLNEKATIQTTNPIILNVRGEADVYVDGEIRAYITDQMGSPIASYDPYQPEY